DHQHGEHGQRDHDLDERHAQLATRLERAGHHLIPPRPPPGPGGIPRLTPGGDEPSPRPPRPPPPPAPGSSPPSSPPGTSSSSPASPPSVGSCLSFSGSVQNVVMVTHSFSSSAHCHSCDSRLRLPLPCHRTVHHDLRIDCS